MNLYSPEKRTAPPTAMAVWVISPPMKIWKNPPRIRIHNPDINLKNSSKSKIGKNLSLAYWLWFHKFLQKNRKISNIKIQLHWYVHTSTYIYTRPNPFPLHSTIMAVKRKNCYLASMKNLARSYAITSGNGTKRVFFGNS